VKLIRKTVFGSFSFSLP